MKFLDAVKKAVEYYQSGRDGTRLPDEDIEFKGFQVWYLIYPFELIRESGLEFLAENMREFYISPDSEIPTRLELAAFGLLADQGYTMVGVFKKTQKGWEHSNRGITIFNEDLGSVLVYLGYPDVL